MKIAQVQIPNFRWWKMTISQVQISNFRWWKWRSHKCKSQIFDGKMTISQVQISNFRWKWWSHKSNLKFSENDDLHNPNTNPYPRSLTRPIPLYPARNSSYRTIPIPPYPPTNGPQIPYPPTERNPVIFNHWRPAATDKIKETGDMVVVLVRHAAFADTMRRTVPAGIDTWAEFRTHLAPTLRPGVTPVIFCLLWTGW